MQQRYAVLRFHDEIWEPTDSLSKCEDATMLVPMFIVTSLAGTPGLVVLISAVRLCGRDCGLERRTSRV